MGYITVRWVEMQSHLLTFLSFFYMPVHLSSPTIAVDQILQSLVSLRLLGPESPYRDLKEERNLRVEEVAPSLIDQIYYIVKLEGRDIREVSMQ